MNEHEAFLATVMEQPYEMGPLLVWADWLQERGDPRGEFLALMPEIVAAIKVLPAEPGATYSERTDAIKLLRTDPLRRLFAALQARFTPLSDGRTVGDLQTDVRSQRFVTSALLHAAGLVTDYALASETARAVEAAQAAWAAEAAWAAQAARAAETAWAAQAAWAAEAARAAETAWAAEAARAARAAEAAVAAGAAETAWADEAAWAARAAGAAETAGAAGAAWAAYRWQLNLSVWLRSRKPLPTRVRRLLRTIHREKVVA